MSVGTVAASVARALVVVMTTRREVAVVVQGQVNWPEEIGGFCIT
jgi:hypothetical protein